MCVASVTAVYLYRTWLLLSQVRELRQAGRCNVVPQPLVFVAESVICSGRAPTHQWKLLMVRQEGLAFQLHAPALQVRLSAVRGGSRAATAQPDLLL